MGEVDHSRDAEADAIYDQFFQGLCELEGFEEHLARAIGVAADMDKAFLRCPKRACRRAGRCQALACCSIDCSAEFGLIGIVAFNAGVRLITRLYLGRLEDTPGGRIRLE